MEWSQNKHPRDATSLSDRIVVFLFFIVGVALAQFGENALPVGPMPRILLSALSAAVLIFSISAAGGVFIPVCALVLGVFVEQQAMSWTLILSKGTKEALTAWISSAILVPVLFSAFVHGMTVSAAIQTAVQRVSPSARDIFQRELAQLLQFLMLAFAAIFYFY